ncbi:unnamed protein product [Orchesella dallaii]|uniref:Uncharacterized protein n=1 Tax=Orchesella dallaii TaxID=48710 RepID=A0ABP1R667_9HEXA
MMSWNRGIEAGMSTDKMAAFTFLSAYWIILHHLRALNFYVWICTILCFRMAFKAVGILCGGNNVRDQNHEHIQHLHHRIIWTMQMFEKLEGFLKEFHGLFGAQLLGMCINILLPMLNAAFELLSAAKSEEFGAWEIGTAITAVPHLISLIMTFFILCDASTALTQEALGLMTTYLIVLQQFSLQEEEGREEP